MLIKVLHNNERNRPWKMDACRGLTDDADSRTDGILGDHGRWRELCLALADDGSEIREFVPAVDSLS